MKGLTDKIISSEIINNAKSNRIELQSIFRQFITKVIINKLSHDITMVTVFVDIYGKDIKNSIKIFLHSASIRGLRKDYNYQLLVKMENNPTYVNDILATNIDDILEVVKKDLVVYPLDKKNLIVI